MTNRRFSRMALLPAFVFWNCDPLAAAPAEATLESLIAAFPIGKAFFWAYGTLGAHETAAGGRPSSFHQHV